MKETLRVKKQHKDQGLSLVGSSQCEVLSVHSVCLEHLEKGVHTFNFTYVSSYTTCHTYKPVSINSFVINAADLLLTFLTFLALVDNIYITRNRTEKVQMAAVMESKLIYLVQYLSTILRYFYFT